MEVWQGLGAIFVWFPIMMISHELGHAIWLKAKNNFYKFGIEWKTLSMYAASYKAENNPLFYFTGIFMSLLTYPIYRIFMVEEWLFFSIILLGGYLDIGIMLYGFYLKLKGTSLEEKHDEIMRIGKPFFDNKPAYKAGILKRLEWSFLTKILFIPEKIQE